MNHNDSKTQTESKGAEEEPVRHRHQPEELVNERTAELEAKNLKLAGEIEAPPVEPAFRRDELLEAVDHDLDLLHDILELFLRTEGEELHAVRQAIRDRDGAALDRHAHRLKGMVATLAAKAAWEGAFILERMGKKQDFTGVDQAFENLERHMDRLRVDTALLLDELREK